METRINPKKEKTLEDLIKTEKKSLENKKKIADLHIAKLEDRLNLALESEHERLVKLIDLHKDHKKTLEETNPQVVATEKFNSLNSSS